jgi:hypothetical protein
LAIGPGTEIVPGGFLPASEWLANLHERIEPGRAAPPFMDDDAAGERFAGLIKGEVGQFLALKR